ncbi:MAG: hypothetical protein ACOYM3_00720 [Terrimicrobiaceae bacterium]
MNKKSVRFSVIQCSGKKVEGMRKEMRKNDDWRGPEFESEIQGESIEILLNKLPPLVNPAIFAKYHRLFLDIFAPFRRQG